jgi:hypothetical protein
MTVESRGYRADCLVDVVCLFGWLLSTCLLVHNRPLPGYYS